MAIKNAKKAVICPSHKLLYNKAILQESQVLDVQSYIWLQVGLELRKERRNLFYIHPSHARLMGWLIKM